MCVHVGNDKHIASFVANDRLAATGWRVDGVHNAVFGWMARDHHVAEVKSGVGIACFWQRCVQAQEQGTVDFCNSPSPESK